MLFFSPNNIFACNSLTIICRIHITRRLSQQQGSTLNVFDRHTKLLQRERAAKDPEAELYDYLKEEVTFICLLYFLALICSCFDHNLE